MMVGVVLPVYNGANYVDTAIESVLAQTHDEYELVVVDDGSTDGTRDIVRSYDDHRVTLVTNDRRQGVAAARNQGVGYVDGDVVGFIDHDDVWHPKKLARHVAAHRTADAALVYSDIRETSADGIVLGERTLPGPAPSGRPLVRQMLFRGGSTIVTMSSVTVTRTAWEQVGGQHTDLRVSADVDLYVQLAGDHSFERVPEPLVDKREHGDNISSDYRAIYRNHGRILDRALERYAFLDRGDERRKRARMAYRRATSALAANEQREAIGFGRESLGYDRRLRPALIVALATVDLLVPTLDPGHSLYATYDRRSRHRE